MPPYRVSVPSPPPPTSNPNVPRSPTTTSCSPSENPPRSPLPWQWRCHKCRSIYRLTVTQRCLYCSHTICDSQASKKRRRCDVEFDYLGWETHANWRRDRLEYLADPPAWEAREAAIDASSRGTEAQRQAQRARLDKKRQSRRDEARLARMVKSTQNCDKDCNYPVQCKFERWTHQELRGVKSPESTSTDGEDEGEGEEEPVVIQESPTSPPESPPSSPESEAGNVDLQACLDADKTLDPEGDGDENDWRKQTSWASSASSSDSEEADGTLEDEES